MPVDLLAEKRQPRDLLSGQQPEPQGRSVFRRVDDAVRGAADMATFGFADELSAWLGSVTGIGGEAGDYAGNVAAQRQRDAEGGVERFAGQMAGAVAMPGMAARSIPQAIGQGALVGGAYGFGSGENTFVDRTKSGAVSAVAGGAAGGVLRGAANALGRKAAAETIPTNDQLRKAAQNAYGRAEAAGVIIKPSGMQRLARDIVDDLAEFGYDPALQPGVAATVRRLQDLSSKNVTLKGLDVVRRVAGNAAKIRDNPSQQALAARIIDRIDDFIDDIPADDVLMGNAAKGSAALREARELWSRLRKSEMVDAAAIKADRRAASTGSGGNADNALRQNVRRIIDNPRLSRGMSDAEKQAAERVVRGTAPQNALRRVGKMAPTGIVSGGIGSAAGATVGSAVGGPAAAAVGSIAVPAIGQGAKLAADKMTVRNAERLSQIIRSGGKTADDLAALARGGTLTAPKVKRIEQVAKQVGVTVPEMSALLKEYVFEGY